VFGNVVCHLAIYSNPIVRLQLSLVKVRRIVLLLNRSGIRYSIVFFILLQIAKTVSNTSTQHAVGYTFQVHFEYITMGLRRKGTKARILKCDIILLTF